MLLLIQQGQFRLKPPQELLAFFTLAFLQSFSLILFERLYVSLLPLTPGGIWGNNLLGWSGGRHNRWYSGIAGETLALPLYMDTIQFRPPALIRALIIICVPLGVDPFVDLFTQLVGKPLEALN